MNTRNRNRRGLILVLSIFVAPFLLAWVLNTMGWRPIGTRNSGELIAPPMDLNDARFTLADGSVLPWKDPDWSWTLFAMPGPNCASHCRARLDELRRVRMTMNQNSSRVRLIVVDERLAPDFLDQLPPLQIGHDEGHLLAKMQPATADELAVAIADPHGFLVLRYPPDYDANGMRKDLARVIKR